MPLHVVESSSKGGQENAKDLSHLYNYNEEKKKSRPNNRHQVFTYPDETELA